MNTAKILCDHKHASPRLKAKINIDQCTWIGTKVLNFTRKSMRGFRQTLIVHTGIEKNTQELKGNQTLDQFVWIKRSKNEIVGNNSESEQKARKEKWKINETSKRLGNLESKWNNEQKAREERFKWKMRQKLSSKNNEWNNMKFNAINDN